MAHREFCHQLKRQCSNDLEYHRVKADRSKAPRRQDFNRLYNTFCKERFGARNGHGMFQCLEERIEQYKENNPDCFAKMQRYEECDDNETIVQPFILTVVTPLMKRVHEMVRKPPTKLH